MTSLDTIDPLEHVVAALQEDIVLGRLAPGARLVEEELAERVNIKRHVLRQAFVELERYGLIERRRNRGALVRQLSLDDVTQIYAVREILERAAAAQIPLPLDRARLDAMRPRSGGTTRRSPSSTPRQSFAPTSTSTCASSRRAAIRTLPPPSTTFAGRRTSCSTRS
jgi:DNA-binding transcriptional regulator YhcF (GntR family)